MTIENWTLNFEKMTAKESRAGTDGLGEVREWKLLILNDMIYVGHSRVSMYGQDIDYYWQYPFNEEHRTDERNRYLSVRFFDCYNLWLLERAFGLEEV